MIYKIISSKCTLFCLDNEKSFAIGLYFFEEVAVPVSAETVEQKSQCVIAAKYVFKSYRKANL